MNRNDNLKAYEEACNLLRHYSNSSLTVRIMSIVQGVALLGGWVIAINGKFLFLLIALPFFGIFFTLFLYRFHLGYYNATAYLYSIAAQMEYKLFDQEFRPMTLYKQFHEAKYGSIKGKLFTLNAPFTLIGFSYMCALVASFLIIKAQQGF